MKKTLFAAVAAATLAGAAFTYGAVAAPDMSDGPPRMMGEASLLLDAKLAGMKFALKLSPEQEKLWSAFETAVRDGVKQRRETMRAMHEAMDSDEPPTPVAMMTGMSDASPRRPRR